MKYSSVKSWPGRGLRMATMGLLVVSSAVSFAQGQSGTTLSATKTLDICSKRDGSWVYSGEVAVLNGGDKDTQNFEIRDHIQSKTTGPVWTDNYFQTLGQGTIIPAGATRTFPYKFVGAPLTGSIRNVADVLITNHSGHITTPPTYFGPSPKASYTGTLPPPACVEDPTGCTYTRGYWGHKPGVVWPSPYRRDAIFYYSGQKAGDIINAPGAGNAYYQLAPQFISAQLNIASGASAPDSLKKLIAECVAWFSNPANTLASCGKGPACSTQRDWAAILDSYNNGLYVGGPGHCGDESAPVR